MNIQCRPSHHQEALRHHQLDPLVRKAPGWHMLNTVWRTEGPSNHLFQVLSQCFLWAPNQMDIRNKSSGLEKYSIWRVRLEKLCSHYIFTRHIIKLRRRPPVAPGADLCSLESPGGFGWAGSHSKSCPPSKEPNRLLRWSTIRPTETLPPRCLSAPGVTEWVDMAAGSHNKHFSKLIFTRRQARTYWMPVSVFRSRPFEDAVQRGPQRGEGWKGSWGAPGSYVLSVLTRPCAASSLVRPQWFFNLKFAPKSLRCHFDFAVTHGVTRPNACGCYALLLYQSLSINSQTFTNKLISIYIMS